MTSRSVAAVPVLKKKEQGDPVLQAVWVDDPDSRYFFWDPLVDGVQWFSDKEDPDKMFFKARNKESIEKYGHLEGIGNMRPRQEWVKLHGKDPMKKENPVPISIDELRMEQKKNLVAFEDFFGKGVERYERLKSAPGRLSKETEEDRELFFKSKYINRQFGQRDDDDPSAPVNYKAVMGNEQLWRDPPKKGLYVNEIDLAAGKITADQNYGAGEEYDDRTTKKKERFNNSEVFYQQWKEAQKVIKGEVSKDLNILRRAHVSGDGIPVVKAVKAWLFQNIPEYSENKDIMFTKKDKCFFALLAAANCAAAIFLIADHGREMGIAGIATITLCAGESIEIVFEKA